MTGSEPSALRLACPACGAAPKRARWRPTSRKSGRVVAACANCGTHWLANPAPAGDAAVSYDFDRSEYESFYRAKRHDTVAAAHQAALDRLGREIQSGGRALFDVGAGAGEFLGLARDAGFDPYGNELAPGAIELAKELTGIDVVLGDLSTIEGSDRYDAVTMWCVLAHVTDPDDLLRQVLRILKPGGVLFFQTPRWSAMDTAGLAAAKATGGRATRVLDRRVTDAHMVLYSKEGLEAQAERIGFEVLEVSPVARYSLQTDSYLRSLRIPDGVSRRAAKGLDLAVDRNLFFRNILDAYLRKPIA